MARNVVITRATPQFTTFNDYDHRYQCCCGCMHVKIGAIIIGILELLGVMLPTGVLIMGNVQKRPLVSEYSHLFGIAASILTILVVVLLFAAIKIKDHYLVIPLLVWQVIIIIGWLIGAIIICAKWGYYGSEKFIEALKNTKEYKEYLHVRGVDTFNVIVAVFIAIIVLFLIWALIGAWFFIVILRLYRYYRDKRYATFSTRPAVQYGYLGAHGPQQMPLIQNVHEMPQQMPLIQNIHE